MNKTQHNKTVDGFEEITLITTEPLIHFFLVPIHYLSSRKYIELKKYTNIPDVQD